MFNNQKILVDNGFIVIPTTDEKVDQSTLATVLSNIAYYGYALTESAYLQLTKVKDVDAWWSDLDKVLKSLTGSDKKMGDFVVYKNFPREVLEMSEAEYWLKQILMYMGVSNEYFTEDEEQREIRAEKLPLKVLQAADEKTPQAIFNSLLKSSVKWTSVQKQSVEELLNVVSGPIDTSAVAFKENLIKLALMLTPTTASFGSATDVLRLATGMSNGDISLRTSMKFRRFKRKERRFLLGLLERCKNISEDAARRNEQFKRLFFELRPGDYKKQFPRTVKVYDQIYRNVKVATFNSEIERLLQDNDTKALNLLVARPGEFMRRLRVATKRYGLDAVEAFKEVIPRLTVHQLVKLERQIITSNDRLYRTFPPKGNWSKLQIGNITPNNLWDEDIAIQLSDLIAKEIGSRVGKVIPSVKLFPDVDKVKLQGNDADLSPYGRGTVFDIPDNITFLRSASYWKTGGGHMSNIWFDNGWNFFDESWDALGVCCWNSPSLIGHCWDFKENGSAAIFSGDPTNSKELQGRACQMIDLYLDKLKDAGVRYAVWNILCYSNKSFNEVEEVHAALQWGEKPQANKLFEPSRCIFSFPIRGDNMTKYIAYVDIKKRQLVYMDANLYGKVNSAAANSKILEGTMPAFVEYLNSLPTVHDLFKNVPISDDGVPIVYDDTDDPVAAEQAYVFLRRNKNSNFKPMDVNGLLKE